MATASDCAPGDIDAFDLHQLPSSAVLLKDIHGEELACVEGNTVIHLSICAGTLLNGPVRLSYHLSGRDRLDRRLLALRQFDALMRLGRISRPLLEPAKNPARRALLIRTLDVLATTSRPREVATELFGPALILKDWQHESDYLRMRTRRLIRQASDLVNGDYLRLLR